MAKKGTYYAGRVLKLCLLDQEMLISAIKRPESIKNRGNAWTFTNIEEYQQLGNHFVFGCLSKYSPEGEVGVVDEVTRSEKIQVEPNLLLASSPFIYIPEHSGIAFLSISGQIEQQTFIKRFSEIIEFTNNNFFFFFSIERMADLKTFA